MSIADKSPKEVMIRTIKELPDDSSYEEISPELLKT
jgi:hypothetical protein